MSRDSSVGIATAYGLDERGGQSSSPGKVTVRVVQIGSGAPPSLLFNEFPGVKAAGA
jgi:hypothetical protein